MPYKCEKMRLSGLQDRRRKLTDEQKEEIRGGSAVCHLRTSVLVRSQPGDRQLRILRC